MKTQPKVTKRQVISWCPYPRGEQRQGTHADVPGMRDEDAKEHGKDAENRKLGEQLLATFKKFKPSHDRFVLQWRMFPNETYSGTDSCGCGCSCGCG